MNKNLSTKLFLYSTNSWLSFRIAELFYNNKHYVWCTPFFDGDMTASNQFSLPPSSTPKEIGICLTNDIKKQDRHSAKIESIKAGIIRGAGIKLSMGIITADENNEIQEIVNQSGFSDFRPLLYIIPVADVIKNLKVVSVSLRAHPLSEEYILEEMDRNVFDIISL